MKLIYLLSTTILLSQCCNNMNHPPPLTASEVSYKQPTYYP